jgi:AraC-like DNA-binding protein
MHSYQSFMEEIPSFFSVQADKSIVYLPKTTGSGFLRNIALEPGLSIRNMDFRLVSDFELFRIARKKTEEKRFQICFFLDNTHFSFVYDEAGARLPKDAFSNILFFSNDFGIHGNFDKGDSVKVVTITVSLSWLEKNGYLNIEIFKPFLKTEKEADAGILFLARPSETDLSLAMEINEHMLPSNNFFFPVRIKALQLIESLFSKMSKNEQLSHEHISGYSLQMVRLEKKINEYLYSHLPQIKVLAREFNMSESNLKRHFVSIYHKNIYEYYLDKKMLLSKRLLTSNNYTVSQVAYELGYEKMASFSHAFKNTFGYLPSVLKKNKEIL